MYPRRVFIALLAALALALGLTACGGDEDEEATTPTTAGAATEAADEAPSGEVRPSGKIITEDMDFADFTAVEAANAFAVDITQSDSFSVELRVDDNIVDLLDVSKDGNTLSLHLKPGTSLTGDVTLEATITMPELNSLELSGASRATVSGFRSSGRLEVELSGASRLDGDLEAGDVDIDASGASRVELEGSATELTIDGSGASTLDLDEFAVDAADITLSGASDATVNVLERIDRADVSGASRLGYRGDPDVNDIHTSGASSVDKID